ncbi:MAG TPA: cupin domain-containing protein [archaeon]|nr:cupin domain-containing protein [archaeon]
MKRVEYKSVELEPVSGPEAKGAGIRWLISAKDGAPNFAMRMIEIEPGGYSPHHLHPGEHEVFVWRGSGELRLEGETFPLAPGIVAYVPPEIKHQFVNTSQKEKLEFICVIPILKND